MNSFFFNIIIVLTAERNNIPVYTYRV